MQGGAPKPPLHANGGLFETNFVTDERERERERGRRREKRKGER